MFAKLLIVAEGIDRANAALGRAVAWLVCGLVAGVFALVVLRYVFGVGSIWLTEGILYMHAAVFLLATAWTLRDNAHVRVDVFYADASPRTKAVIDLLGSVVLLLPFALAVLWLSLPYVSRSWVIFERSHESGGLPAVFILKTLIPLFALTFALQGLSQAIHAAHVLRTAHVLRGDPA